MKWWFELLHMVNYCTLNTGLFLACKESANCDLPLKTFSFLSSSPSRTSRLQRRGFT